MTQTDGHPTLEPPKVDDDPLGHLYKMSPTAGVATTDYASINTLAIFAILLGVASILSVFSTFLLVVPLAGLVCGIVAIRQVRNSNGTQVGLGLSIAGLLLSLGLGGSVLAYNIAKTSETRAKEKLVAALISDFGSLVADGKYGEAYEKTSLRFRQRVPKDLFVRQMSSLNSNPQFGKLLSIKWNNVPMLIEVNPDSQAQFATAIAYEQVQRYAQPIPETMVFSNDGNGWLIEDISRLFPTKSSKQDGPPAPGADSAAPSAVGSQ